MEKEILEAELVTEVKLWDLSPNELLNIKSDVALYKKIKKLSYFCIPIAFVLGLFMVDVIGTTTYYPLTLSLLIGLILAITFNFWTRKKMNSVKNKYHIISKRDMTGIIDDIIVAQRAEFARNYNKAIDIWEKLGILNRAAHLRTLISDNSKINVTQKVVHGDEVTKTEIKDSVLNRSNVGGGSSKMQELEKLAEMKDKGIIDDAEFKQMKKEILDK